MSNRLRAPILLAAALATFAGVQASLVARVEADAPPATSPAQSAPVCNPLSREEFARHEKMTKTLRTAIMERKKLPDGYAFRIDPALLPFLDLAAWVEAERRCCSFFTFQIRLTADLGPVWLELTGPEDAQEIIRETLGGS